MEGPAEKKTFNKQFFFALLYLFILLLVQRYLHQFHFYFLRYIFQFLGILLSLRVHKIDSYVRFAHSASIVWLFGFKFAGKLILYSIPLNWYSAWMWAKMVGKCNGIPNTWCSISLILMSTAAKTFSFGLMNHHVPCESYPFIHSFTRCCCCWYKHVFKIKFISCSFD